MYWNTWPIKKGAYVMEKDVCHMGASLDACRKETEPKILLELMQHWAKRVHPSRPFCFDADNGGQSAMSNSFEGCDMEYIKKTKSCLKAMPHWKRRAVLLRADIEDLQGRIRADAVPRVSDMASQGRGSSFLASQEERAAERREQWEAEIQEKQDALCRIEPKIGRITRAIESLPDNERKIIEGKYLDGLTWQGLAMKMNYSAGYCRIHADKAIGDLAVMLFGQNACPAMFPDDLFIM